jgi:hypothetical protein
MAEVSALPLLSNTAKEVFTHSTSWVSPAAMLVSGGTVRTV